MKVTNWKLERVYHPDKWNHNNSFTREEGNKHFKTLSNIVEELQNLLFYNNLNMIVSFCEL